MYIYDKCSVAGTYGPKTKGGSKISATRHHDHYQGKQCLNIHLLKPARVWAETNAADAPGNQHVVGANGDTAQGQLCPSVRPMTLYIVPLSI